MCYNGHDKNDWGRGFKYRHLGGKWILSNVTDMIDIMFIKPSIFKFIYLKIK